MSRKPTRRNAPIPVSMSTLVALTNDTPVLVEQNRVRHAAHYMYDDPRKGHDLDRWVVRSAVRPTFEQLAALGLPSDAEYHTGYRDHGMGRQHWVYIARRPLSEGACERCGCGDQRAAVLAAGLVVRVTAETITDEQIDQLRVESLAPHGYVGDTYYWASLSKQTIPGVRDPTRAWLAAAWNARHGGNHE